MHTNAHKCTDDIGPLSGNALKQRGFPLFVQQAKKSFAGCTKWETTVLGNLS